MSAWFPPPQTDTAALNYIAASMDQREWSPDTLDFIAAMVRATGRQVRDSGEVEQL